MNLHSDVCGSSSAWWLYMAFNLPQTCLCGYVWACMDTHECTVIFTVIIIMSSLVTSYHILVTMFRVVFLKIQLFYITWRTGQGLYKLLTMVITGGTQTCLHLHVSRPLYHCAADTVSLLYTGVSYLQDLPFHVLSSCCVSEIAVCTSVVKVSAIINERSVTEVLWALVTRQTVQ